MNIPEMDPIEVYKRYLKIEKPEIQVDGYFIFLNEESGWVPIEMDPDFRRIKRCVEFRRTRPEATPFLCSCDICVKVVLHELYNIVYEK